MKHCSVIVVALVCLGAVAVADSASALTVINETITPLNVNTGTVFRGDGTWLAPNSATADSTTGAPGWGTSSFISNITGPPGYTEFQINLDALFGRALTINDLASISYDTKNNAGTVQDWDIRLYTDKQAGDVSFYHNRFEANPPVSTGWQTWSTDTNLKIDNVHSGTNGANTPVNDTLTDLHASYGSELIQYLSFITGASGNTSPIANNLDGIVIRLSDGSVANINLAAVPEPSSLVLIGFGAVGTIIAARRRRQCV